MTPHTLQFVPPTAYDVPAGTTSPALDPAKDLAGLEIQLDGQPAVAVPFTFVDAGPNQFDMSALAPVQALAPGQHTVTTAVVTVGGTVGDFSAAATFPVDGKPLAPPAVGVV